MKTRLNISLRQRIHWSFSLLVLLFVTNGVITLFTIHSNKKIAINIFKVISPSLQSLDDLNKMMLESKMYATNWVFLRSGPEDKQSLRRIHDSGYAALKSRINQYSPQWQDKNWMDSLNRIYTGFEELLVIEKNIMSSLSVFKDYDDPVIKLEAERIVKEEILPRTSVMMNSLDAIRVNMVRIRTEKGNKLERTSLQLRLLIIGLTITIILAGFLLSRYMTRMIITPVNRIRHIINDLGLGIIQKINRRVRNDEIGKMVLSVNNLSEKLGAIAVFAREVGRRNFDIPYKPLSNEDTLGKALIAMRENIKSGDEKLNEAQHIARLGSWERDIETDTMTLTDEMFNIFDIDPLSFDFRFQTILKLIHPGDIENVMETMRKNRYRAPESIECRIVTSKGVIKDILVNTKVKMDKYGEIETTFGVVQDITERKKAEAKLHKSEERYRQIVETAQEGIWLIDENNYTTLVNKKMAALLEYSTAEMMGKLNYCFMDDEWKQKAREHIESRKLGMNETHDFKYITKSGKDVWATLSTNPVFDDNGIYRGALAMVNDITQRKLDDELLRQSETNLAVKNNELEQKNKELEQFAYVASHDLQEPLRTTTSFVDLLQKKYKGKLDEKADKYLSFIAQSSGRMEILIKDLLDYSRIGHKKEFQKVDCNRILREVLADLDTAIMESQVSIKAEPLPVISGYPTEVKQLFQNLVANAIKFRKKGITPEINISVKKSMDYWEFTFEDNGIGIEKQHSERIFIIFQRLHTRTEYEGSGIGLSHCKKIVELHHGKIWVESTPGKGSTFHFNIPEINN